MSQDNPTKMSATERLPIDRREYLRYTGVLAGTGIIGSGTGTATSTGDASAVQQQSVDPLPAPTALKVEYEQSPNNIDPSTSPRFSWEIDTQTRNRAQSAYRVIVASSKSAVQNRNGDVWDSGKVASSQCFNIPIGADSLSADTTYYWSVRVWDKADQSTSWSTPSQFTTALPAGSESWSGDWIGSPIASEDGNQDVHPAPLLRKEFSFNKKVESARLHVSGLGFYVLHINGDQIGDRVLDPGRTDYDETVLYSTYDIADALSQGQNAIGLELGRGRLGELVEDYWGWSDAPWWSDPQALVQLNVEFTDGTSRSIVSDEQWSVTDGPTRFDSIYAGDRYDARKEQPGWDTPGFDDSDWDEVTIVDPPAGETTPQRLQPIEITDTYTPVEMNKPKDGRYIFDLGEQIAGWVELTVQGEAGTEVTITQGESLNDGKVANDNSQLNQPMQVDTYTLKGEGTEIWEPSFSYKGFRYVQLDGFPGEPSLDSIEAKALHTPVEKEVESSFDSSNDLFGWIHQNTREAMLLNLHSVHTDSPTWEKNGWTEHSLEMGPSLNYNFWMPRFWPKYLRDCADAQGNEGNIPYIAPTPEYGYELDPGWGASYVHNAWDAYRYYGDMRVLKEHYAGMKNYVEFIRGEIDGHIVRTGLGDWSSPAGAIPPEGPNIVSTGCYYRSVEVVAETAELLGNDGDASEYRDLVSDIEAAFNDEFFNPETNVYSTGETDEYRQTSNLYPLAFEMVPNGHEDAVAANLAENVMVTENGHLNVGAHGLQYLLPMLTEHGYHKAAMTVATQDTFPSWGWWRVNGEVSLLENWDLGTRSRTHDFLGSIDQWFYQYLAGIQAPDKPGFKKVTIKPYVSDNLQTASATTDTIRGTISSTWEQVGDNLQLDVTIPWNTTAEIHVPAKYKQAVTEGGTPATEVNSLSFLREEGEFAVFETGSGQYQFTSDPVRGSAGFVRDRAQDLRDLLNSLVESGKLKKGWAKSINERLQSLQQSAETIIEAREAGNEEDGVAAISKALRTLSKIERWVTRQNRKNRLSDDTTSEFETAIADIREALLRANELLFDLNATLDAPESIRAGSSSTMTASITNNGDASINNLSLSINAPEGWTVSVTGSTQTGSLKPGETFSVAYDLTIPVDQPPKENVELTGIAEYQYQGRSETVPLSTEITVNFARLPDRFETFASTEARFGRVGEELVIDANGVDIFTDNDQYGAIYDPNVQMKDGDTATVKVVSQENTSDYAKAGLMVRNDITAAGESTGYSAVMTRPSTYEFEWDSNGDGNIDDATNTGETTYPCYLRLDRNGSTFTSYYSTDGNNWTEIGSSSLPRVAATQDVAMFSTSHSEGTLGRSDFTEFDVRST